MMCGNNLGVLTTVVAFKVAPRKFVLTLIESFISM